MKLKVHIFKPLIFASLIFLSIEVITFFRIGKAKITEASIENTFFDNKFKKLDVGQKYFVLYKSQIFKNNNADFIQIGDSSGFFGIRPNIINTYLNGLDFLNISCCADSGWDGYVYQANYYLKNNPDAKYLVLYTSPYSLPMQYKKGFSEDLNHIFGDIKDKNFFKVFNYIPTLYYRKRVLNFLYQNSIEDKEKEYKRAMDNLGIAKNFESYTGYKYEQLLEYLKFSRGWLPFDRKDGWKDMPIAKCGPSILRNFYDASGKPTLNSALQKVKNITDRYDVNLIVIFNPVACEDSEKIVPIHNDLLTFKKSNPDVFIPFDFINSIDKEEFSDHWHLTPKASIFHSHKVGKVLGNYINTSE
ncbi:MULTISPECIES: hypothetical protein [Prochlorococcus]|uniref:Uncharacterized protein n=1 Tax=Prochlorococcus marinus str. MIT 9116 TaxID=167544 RepID=A0A0A1ZX21_PROMR|nr:hypothetical protein [Prochlorococcus marinus]KGF91713.1 hypothetical protein EU92_0458 [Prochlorococcus marinus str. MIT 9107]KGF93101.1 hypothetical protein EU93_0276 [Prochlorococcus marinus str. MIT 9116]KGF95078.1 hypothetical protein EU94_0376 [Prochlorococcus marinus str. MIT 9123]